MINLEIANELMIDMANDAYSIIEGSHPNFLVQEWLDKITLCRMMRSGIADVEDIQQITMWSQMENLSPMEFAEKTVAEHKAYIKMRSSLVYLYKSSAYKASTSKPEDLPAVFQEILATSEATFIAFSNGDAVLEERLLSALNQMKAALEETLS